MAALRFSALAIVLVASLASAATTGSTSSCPAIDSTTKLYANTSSTCTAATSCYTKYCSCMGLTVVEGLTCSTPSSTISCSNASSCAADAISCLNTASSSCTNLKDLHMSILALESGAKLYNESTTYSACKARVCAMVNATAGSNCTLAYDSLCVSPVSFVGTLLLKGNFSGILANAAQREAFAAALEKDLIKALGILDIFVTRLYVYGTPQSQWPPKRTRSPSARRQGTDVLVVEFEAPGVSSKNTAFASALTAVQSGDGSWLATTTSTYSTLTGGQTLTFVGVVEGTGSSALSSGIVNSLVGTPTPSTATPSTPSPDGAAMQSVLAAVAVAALSALLF